MKNIKVGSILRFTGGRFYQITAEEGDRGVYLYHFNAKSLHFYSFSLSWINNSKDWSLATKEEIDKLVRYIPHTNEVGVIYNYLIL